MLVSKSFLLPSSLSLSSTDKRGGKGGWADRIMRRAAAPSAECAAYLVLIGQRSRR